MLPFVKNTATAIVTALTIASVAAAPAQAGKGDFARGVATAVVVGALIGAASQGHAQPRPQPQPEPVWGNGHGHHNNPPQVYYQPAPRISIYDTAAAVAFNSYSRGERRAIQRSLRAEGYYYGALDGSFGPSTYRAVAAYADDVGMGRSLRSAGGAYGVYDSLLY